MLIVSPADEWDPSGSKKKSYPGNDTKLHHWWGSSSGDLVNLKYPFIVITLRSTLNCSKYICLEYIDESNRSVEKIINIR